MIAIIDLDNYENILYALEDGAVHYSFNCIDDGYSTLADIHEVIDVTAKCLGRRVKAYYTEDKKNFESLEEKLDKMCEH
tara:strand:- start:39247 stop:39483 length:237 start_codon:yes stop_codon:yes gene_type:complete